MKRSPAPAPSQPLRLLVLADLGSSTDPGPQVLDDADGFGRLLAAHAPRLELTLASREAVTLQVSTLRDLSPEGLGQQVPSLAVARELAEAIRAAAGGKREALEPALAAAAAIPGLAEAVRLARQGLGEPAPGTAPSAAPPAPPVEGSAERILELVEVPSADKRATSAIGHIVGAIGRKRGGASPELAQAEAQAIAFVQQQLDELLHHPELQRLEASWRGLRLLVDRCDFRRQVRLEVVQATPATLPVQLEALAAREAEVDLVLAPLLLEDPEHDVPLLERLARAGEALQAPVVTSLGLRFLAPGSDPDRLEPLDPPSVLLEAPRFASWSALRGEDCAHWLSALLNRFLLRAPHAPVGGGRGYTEQVACAGEHLWGDPVWLLGSLVACSFAGLGWPTEISGNPSGKVEDLPVRTQKLPGRGTVRSPLEAPLLPGLVQELARCGLAALCAPENSDAAFALYTPTVFRLPEAGKGGRVIALAYQLLASRIARQLSAFKPSLIGLASPEAVQAALEAFIDGLLATTGPQARAEVRVAPAEEGLEVSLQLRTGRDVLGGVGVELAFTLPA